MAVRRALPRARLAILLLLTCARGTAAADSTILITALFGDNDAHQIGASIANFITFTDTATMHIIAHLSATSAIERGDAAAAAIAREMGATAGGSVSSPQLPPYVHLNPERGVTAHATGTVLRQARNAPSRRPDVA